MKQICDNKKKLLFNRLTSSAEAEENKEKKSVFFVIVILNILNFYTILMEYEGDGDWRFELFCKDK